MKEEFRTKAAPSSLDIRREKRQEKKKHVATPTTANVTELQSAATSCGIRAPTYIKAMRGRITQVVKLLRNSKNRRENGSFRDIAPNTIGERRRSTSLRVGFILSLKK
jgi:hypothetical protein